MCVFPQLNYSGGPFLVILIFYVYVFKMILNGGSERGGPRWKRYCKNFILIFWIFFPILGILILCNYNFFCVSYVHMSYIIWYLQIFSLCHFMLIFFIQRKSFWEANYRHINLFQKFAPFCRRPCITVLNRIK